MENVLKLAKNCAHGWTGSPSRCGACRSEKRKAERANMPDGRAKNVIADENGRNCLKCGEIKSWDSFAMDVHGFNQKTATCKPCRNKYRQENYPEKRDNSMKGRPDRVMQKYGVTYDHIIHTLAAQFGRCANTGCGKEISLDVSRNSKDRAVIDHCHTSGKFRAILCPKCNLDLGMIETNETRFLGLIEYKAKHNYKERK